MDDTYEHQMRNRNNDVRNGSSLTHYYFKKQNHADKYCMGVNDKFLFFFYSTTSKKLDLIQTICFIS